MASVKPLLVTTFLALGFVATLVVSRQAAVAQQQSGDLVAEISEIGSEYEKNENGQIVSIILTAVDSVKALDLMDSARGELASVKFVNCNLDFKLIKGIQPFDSLKVVHFSGCDLIGSIPTNIFGHVSKLRIEDSRVSKFDFEGLFNLKLTFLRIHGSDISDNALSVIGKIKSLEEIQLFENNQITNSGVSQLGELPKLKYLRASDMKISGEAFKNFSPDNLVHLDIHNTLLNDSSMNYISRFENLKVLAVNETGLSDKCIEQFGSFKRMEMLNLSNTKITDTGFAAIRSLPRLSKLDKGVVSEYSAKSYFLIDLSKDRDGDRK